MRGQRSEIKDGNGEGDGTGFYGWAVWGVTFFKEVLEFFTTEETETEHQREGEEVGDV